MEEMIRGEFQITNISKANFVDVFDFENGEIWYKCKVVYTDIDEKSGKEKNTNAHMLVMAVDVRDAYDKLEESLKEMVVPYEVKAIQDSNIMDIFPYQPSESVDKMIGDNLKPASDFDDSDIDEDYYLKT
jgi:hypothetical protein